MDEWIKEIRDNVRELRREQVDQGKAIAAIQARLGRSSTTTKLVGVIATLAAVVATLVGLGAT